MTRLSLSAAALLAMCGSPAHAQQQLCGPTLEILPAFAAEYGETPLFTGLSASGFVVAVIVNPETGSFSVFRMDANGVACLLDVGEGGRVFEPKTPGEPS